MPTSSEQIEANTDLIDADYILGVFQRFFGRIVAGDNLDSRNVSTKLGFVGRSPIRNLFLTTEEENSLFVGGRLFEGSKMGGKRGNALCIGLYNIQIATQRFYRLGIHDRDLSKRISHERHLAEEDIVESPRKRKDLCTAEFVEEISLANISVVVAVRLVVPYLGVGTSHESREDVVQLIDQHEGSRKMNEKFPQRAEPSGVGFVENHKRRHPLYPRSFSRILDVFRISV